MIHGDDGHGKTIIHIDDLDCRLLKIIGGNGNEITNVYDDASGTSCPSCSGASSGKPAKTIFLAFTRAYDMRDYLDRSC